MQPTLENHAKKVSWSRLIQLGLIFLFLLPTISGSVNQSNFAPYIEKYAMGSIDWDNGLIYGIGRGYLDNNNQSKLRATGAAQLIASGNIAKLAAGLRLDDQKTLEDLGKEKVTITIKAFIRDLEVSQEWKEENGRSFVEIVRVAHLKGINGITAKIVSNNSKDPVDWIPSPRPSEKQELEDEDEPWLVLDARSLPLMKKAQPAIFPKIINDQGEEIYGLRLVKENALVQRGMASYVILDAWQSKQEPIESILEKVSAILSAREAFAAADRQRTKRKRFVVMNVNEAKGLQRTNLVVSATDAKDLKTEDASSKILQNCRVIVIMSSPVGGIEGAIFRIINLWS